MKFYESHHFVSKHTNVFQNINVQHLPHNYPPGRHVALKENADGSYGIKSAVKSKPTRGLTSLTLPNGKKKLSKVSNNTV